MRMKNTIVIAAFPACGKSYMKRHSKLTIMDSDSSKFSWLYQDGQKTDQRNPLFPDNYIERIQKAIGKYDIILVSTHQIVRDAMRDAGIDFITIYPDISAKSEWIKRCIKRGDSPAFIKGMDEHWDEWIKSCEAEPGLKINMTSDQYLFDFCRDVQIGHIFQHYDGWKCCVIMTANMASNMQSVCIYQRLDTKDVLVMPMNEFCGLVDHEKHPDVRKERRYTFVDTGKTIKLDTLTTED